MLEGDPKRQAIHSLRGYSYQIWQSLDMWISLTEEDVIYLEGAEDIDKLAVGYAETIQVKDLQSGSLTLNSPEILDAIKHFWEHKIQNPNISIKYRFLTTADRSKERPAIVDIKGLDYWDECKHQQTNIQPLKEFLLSKDIPSDLKTFITASDDKKLREELIRCIEWDTGNPERPHLEDLIIEKLKLLGNRFGILPTESAKALPALLKYVFGKASSQGDRSLTFIDLREQFEAQTTTNVPTNVMTQALSALGGQFEGLLGAMSSSCGNIPIDIAQRSITPVIPSRYSKRIKLVASLSDTILRHKLLVLYGSTGMGKSTVGILLVENLSLECQWVNLRGNGAHSINSILMSAALRIDNFEDKILVIDDISIGPDIGIFENALIALINVVLSKNGYIIITTQNNLPDKVSHHIFSLDDLTIDVPTMELEEIVEVAELYGCPAGDKLKLWSKFIELKTGGHPQLVHAKIRGLEASGWPMPTLNSLTKPDNFETIKSEVKKRLIAEMPFESARTLAYRLSIFTHPFKRCHALIMGEKAPAISNPGEDFDLLVGPWVERLSSDYYRISPLLRNMASDIWPADEVKTLHAQAVTALLSEKTLSPIEASNAIYYGILGECGEILVPLIRSLLTSDKNILSMLAEDLRLLTAIALSPGQKLYHKNPLVSLSLRHIQFRVASEIDKKDTAIKVSLAWEHEISELESGEFKDGARILFLLETLIRIEVPFSLAAIISKTKEAYKLLSDTTKAFGKKTNLSLEGEGSIAHMSLFAIARCENHIDLEELLIRIDQEEKEIRDLYLSFLDTESDWANFLIGKIYLHEFNAPSPEWQQCLDAFSKTIELGKKWETTSLISNAYHMIAVIHDEHLDNSEKALTILDEARVALGDNNPIIEDGRAMIHFRQKNDSEVLEILDGILANWLTTFDPTPLFAYRRAEISAIGLGDWGKAASFALEASEVAKRLDKTLYEVGFKADHAFALWKLGNKESSIDMFSIVLQDFSRLPDPNESLHSFTLQKFVGHAVMWMLNDIKNDSLKSLVEPTPACFSNNEMDERIKELPLQAMEFFWMYLAEIELELGMSNNIFTYFHEMYSLTKYPVIRVFLHKAKIAHSLRSGKIQKLVIDYYDCVSCIETSKKLVSKPSDVLSQLDRLEPVKVTDGFIELLIILLSLALIKLTQDDRDLNECISTWRDDLKSKGILNSSLTACLALLENASDITNHNLTEIMFSRSAGTGERIIASLLLSRSNTISPETTFNSHLILFNIASDEKSIWGKEIENSLMQIITPIWTEIANRKAFSLMNPKMNVPKILDACSNKSSGFNKIAKVLYAAKDSVNLIIPPDMLLSLKNHIN